MKYYVPLIIFMCVFCIQSALWAESCEICFEKTASGEKLCPSCKKQYPTYNTSSREEQLLTTVTKTRKNHRRALWELVQFYQIIGNHTRLRTAQRELEDFDRSPQPLYSLLLVNKENVHPSQSIPMADALFEEGKALKSSYDIINKKAKQTMALEDFSRILQEYPESDKADDAAFEIAEIYSGLFFKEYEWAAEHYVKSHRWGPESSRPALYLAAKIYDEKLKDYPKAAQLYKEAAEVSPTTKLKKISKKRAEELAKLGF
ncbi:MAG: tol-pal system YbgF family protein [Candidatus Hydrothermarchaeales archaeon]